MHHELITCFTCLIVEITHCYRTTEAFSKSFKCLKFLKCCRSMFTSGTFNISVTREKIFREMKYVFEGRLNAMVVPNEHICLSHRSCQSTFLKQEVFWHKFITFSPPNRIMPFWLHVNVFRFHDSWNTNFLFFRVQGRVSLFRSPSWGGVHVYHARDIHLFESVH